MIKKILLVGAVIIVAVLVFEQYTADASLTGLMQTQFISKAGEKKKEKKVIVKTSKDIKNGDCTYRGLSGGKFKIDCVFKYREVEK